MLQAEHRKFLAAIKGLDSRIFEAPNKIERLFPKPLASEALIACLVDRPAALTVNNWTMGQ